jgi:uncharacterized protein YndB with AHSA1/START domain
MTRTLSLVVRRTILATPERLFDAWTLPEQLTKWWGPIGASCPHADIDLRVGGSYRITNLFATHETLHISGEFRVIERPNKLVYTWRIEESEGPAELVTVLFEAREAGSELIVIHERIGDRQMLEGHEAGWHVCIDGLVAYVSAE